MTNTTSQHDNRFHIAFIETGSGQGGSAHSLLKIMQVLKQDYADTITCTLIGLSKDAVSIFDQAGFKTLVATATGFWGRLQTMRVFKQQYKFDLIHSNNSIYTPLPFLLPSIYSKTPVTVHVRASRPLTFRERFFFRRVDHSFAVSQSAYALLSDGLQLDKSRITNLGDGTNLQAYMDASKSRQASRNNLNLNDNDFVVVLPATLQPGKGQETAIHAAAALQQAGKQIKWLFAGAEHYQFAGFQKMLGNLIEEKNLSDQIQLLGHSNNMPAVMAAADIAILPSTLTEGTPCVIMEAMAAGKPVIASDIGGIPEAVDNTVGSLVAAGNIDNLSTAIALLYDDRDLLKKQGKIALERASKIFDIKVISRNMLTVFEQLTK